MSKRRYKCVEFKEVDWAEVASRIVGERVVLEKMKNEKTSMDTSRISSKSGQETKLIADIYPATD